MVALGRQLSLPSWERGLKFQKFYTYFCQNASLPSWERGLKSVTKDYGNKLYLVAPLVGAWIEIMVQEMENEGARRRSPRGSVD